MTTLQQPQQPTVGIVEPQRLSFGGGISGGVSGGGVGAGMNVRYGEGCHGMTRKGLNLPSILWFPIVLFLIFAVGGIALLTSPVWITLLVIGSLMLIPIFFVMLPVSIVLSKFGLLSGIGGGYNLPSSGAYGSVGVRY